MQALWGAKQAACELRAHPSSFNVKAPACGLACVCQHTCVPPRQRVESRCCRAAPSASHAPQTMCSCSGGVLQALAGWLSLQLTCRRQDEGIRDSSVSSSWAT